jgi:hypothetical protein
MSLFTVLADIRQIPGGFQGMIATLLHGSAGWRRELGGVGRRPLS